MSRRWAIVLLVVLGVSLAANLVTAGAAARWFWLDPPGGRELIDRTITLLAGRYPPGLRERIAGEVRSDMDDFKSRSHAYFDARNAVRAAIRAEPFDRAALEKALADQRARIEDVQRLVHEAVVRAVEKAPAAERAEVKLRERKPERKADDSGDDRPVD